jgi:hypothetical protein
MLDAKYCHVRLPQCQDTVGSGHCRSGFASGYSCTSGRTGQQGSVQWVPGTKQTEILGQVLVSHRVP